MFGKNLFRRAGAVALGLAAGVAAALVYFGAARDADAGSAAMAATDLAGAWSEAPVCRGRIPRQAARERLARLQRYADTLPRYRLADNPLGDDDPDLDLMEKLGLLEGHLMIGKMLADAGKLQDALPHFGHPVRELYDYLKPALEKRKLRAYDGQFKQLETTVKTAGHGAKVDAEYAAAIAWVADVRNSIPAPRRADGKFVLNAVALLLEDAAEDFGESLENGRIVNTVEYHDAMGFALYTKAMLAAYRPHADAFAQSRIDRAAAEIEAVLAAFPSLAPPPAPQKSVLQLKAAAARVKDLTK
ncbi:MAG: hypothetical protein KIT16_13735 [Rhodospirillaceae bacterium]|nr:hypothetical protein [Rhodospirillaceae bacterium]